MYRSDPAERNVRNAEIKLGKYKLESNYKPDKHAHNSPYHSRNGEHFNSLIVVVEFLHLHTDFLLF